MNMNHHDLPTDEIRRELRAIDRTNTEVMPKWREVLHRVIGGDERMTADDKAAILGVPSPSRRQLFKFGGAAIIGAAVLAACGDDNDDSKSTTTVAGGSATTAGGATTMAPSTMAPATTMAPTTTAKGGGAAQDVVLARTAASLEKLAVDTYGAAAALLTTKAIKDAATMFADHHQMHLDALNGVITGAGGKAVTAMNQAVYDALVKPAVDAAKTETDAVNLAVKLEEAAAQTYVFAGGALSTPALRSTIMTIGGVEARHAAVLRMAALGQSPLEVFPSERAFFPGDNPLAAIPGALITS
jgi:rubrerythrin